MRKDAARVFEPLSHDTRYNIAVYDIETPGIEDDRFLLVGFFDGDRYYRFHTLSSFLDHVCSRRYRNWYIFGHYGGRFDARYLADLLRYQSDLPYTFGYFLSGSTCVLLSVRSGGDVWHFCDSGRLLPASLERLTEEFGVEHRKLAFDPAGVEYNFNDCLGLYEVLQRFFSVVGVYAYTIASLSMRYFRRNYLRRRIYNVGKAVEAFVRSGYYGGRCEIYRRDEATVNKYDVNSLYPYAMSGPVPVDYIGATTVLPDDDRRIGFYRARVRYPYRYIPALPLLMDHRLYFPIGEYEGVWTSMELRRAIEDGASVDILSGHCWAAEPIFDEFVRDVYERKVAAEREGNWALRTIYKLLGNSLYGKFGQARIRRVYIQDPGTSRLDPDDPVSPFIWPLPDGMAFYLAESDSRHIMPHIAATVTARARLSMLERLRAALPCWYTDTDSIITTREIDASDGLGDLKFEGRGRFRAYGLKEYEWEDSIRIKGLPRRNEQDIEMARRYLQGEPVRYRRMAGLQESVRAGMSAVRTVDCERRRRFVRPKRAPEGEFDTRPWYIKDMMFR